MNSDRQLIAKIQKNVIQKKGQPCSGYSNGIDIITNSKGEPLWEKERLEACQR